MAWARTGLVLVLVAGCILSGCATLFPGREEPEIHLTSVQALPRDGLEQRFLIGLNIVNLGSSKLDIAGLSYSLLLNGQKVASGVSGNLASIPGYSESKVRLQASTNLLGSLRVISKLLQDPNPGVNYQLITKIRTSWWPVPMEVIEEGTIDLGNYLPSGSSNRP